MLLISIITLIGAMALPVLNKLVTSHQINRITFVSLILSSLLSFNTLNLDSLGEGVGIYGGLFHISNISQIFEIFIFLIGALILMGWYLLSPNGGKNIIHQSDYSLIVLFSILGSSLLISSFDLISIYLSIELQSFGLYILATLYKDSESSTAAGLKYFLLGGLSSCIILLGIGLIYSYTGLTNLESLYILAGGVNTFNSTGAYGFNLLDTVLNGYSLGFILIFVGFLFKIAAAPLHNWSPDVYDGTPTIVTSWLTIIPKISILILLLELTIHLGSVDVIKNLLLLSSLLSLIVGSLLGLAQIRIKRLLAYSTISHIGFLLLALAINSEISIDSFLFYLIVYTITNLNIFLIILAFSYLLSQSKGEIKLEVGHYDKGASDLRYLSEFKGLLFSNPFLSLSLATSLFSLAGIPPLIGFFSKQFVLYSALVNGYYFISVVAILVSVISASYYLKIVKLLIEEENVSDLDPSLPAEEVSENSVELSNIHSYLIATLTLIILLFFIKPSLILNSSKLLTLAFFNT